MVDKVQASATNSGTVTKSDSTPLSFKCIYVGGAGNVAIKHTESGAASVFPNIPAGTFLPAAGVRVMSTGTTATDMVWMDW